MTIRLGLTVLLLACTLLGCSNPSYRVPCVPAQAIDGPPVCVWWTGEGEAALKARFLQGAAEAQLVTWLHDEGFEIVTSEMSGDRKAIYESTQTLMFCEPWVWTVTWKADPDTRLVKLHADQNGFCMLTP